MKPSLFRQTHQQSAATRNSCWTLESDYVSTIWAMTDPRNRATGSAVSSKEQESLRSVLDKRMDECQTLMISRANFPANTRAELAKLPMPSPQEAVNVIDSAPQRQRILTGLSNTLSAQRSQWSRCLGNADMGSISEGNVAEWKRVNTCAENFRNAAVAVGRHLQEDDLATMVRDSELSDVARAGRRR